MILLFPSYKHRTNKQKKPCLLIYKIWEQIHTMYNSVTSDPADQLFLQLSIKTRSHKKFEEKKKKMFVKDVCSNAQTISKTRKYFSCVIMQPLHPQKFSFSSEKTFISSVHYPELGKPHNCKTNGGKTEDLIYSEQITYKISFDKLSEIRCCHCLWQSTSPTILNFA